ncbi:MAG: hypothetical protein IKV72_00230 [Firmicutes bacterium]|nr:hypothetical protein [Bacillota bacterium]
MEIIKPNTNLEKARAAYVLETEITELELMLQRATLILQDLWTDYLDNRKLDGKSLEFYRDNACIRSEIVSDYLCRMSDKVQELCALATGGAA